MIISCPSCNTKFKVDDKLIPDAGRKVRCSNCKIEWVATKTTEEINIDHIINENSKVSKANQKVYEETSKWFYLFPLTTFIFLFFIACIFAKDIMVKKLPILEPLYSYMGYYDTKGLRFTDLSFNPAKTNQGNFILINGKIVNFSDKIIPTIYMRIILKDKDNIVLVKQVLPYSSNEQINPKQVLNVNYPMRIWFDYERIASVEIDIASQFEFAFNIR
ncbi:MAG: zinc-ribbon domain-containing protein [Sphingobacteriia bacterium]|nr:zinc-ribbon domain-containing protein [Sphingobacteriia bacterium]